MEQTDFLKDCETYGQEIIEAAQDIIVIFGNVAIDWKRKNKDGLVRKYDAAFTAQNGTLISAAPGFDFVAKTVLPACHQCDTPRYFSGQERLLKDKRTSLKNGWGSVAVTVQGKEYKLGLLLCEDGLTDNGTDNVPSMLKKSGAEIICNLSSQPLPLEKTASGIYDSASRQKNCSCRWCTAITPESRTQAKTFTPLTDKAAFTDPMAWSRRQRPCLKKNC